MNTTIIKGTMKVGLGKAVKRWAGLTGNRKLYVEGVAEEWIGRTQRSYGRLKDASRDITKMVAKRAKKMHLPIPA
ncbi:MAG: hypothetical protein JWO03_1287 [Bacteroidetes bacterium]|nr:hypothetical protein [Bacteroidota bacterium]